MSLIYCPECGHEISHAAIACPNCGRPLNRQPIAPAPVVVERVDTGRVPPWVIAPVILLGVLVLFGLIYMLSMSGDESNTNLAVNVRRSENPNRRASEPVTTSDVSSAPVTVVPGETASLPTDPPQTVTVPGSQIATAGTILINARVVQGPRNVQAPVRNVKFYLLDKDIESILDDAGIEPIEGQSQLASLGMSVADPAAYGYFYDKVQRALREHIKFAGSTDATGRVQLGSVKPDSYYLFGVTRVGNGFAIWNAPVTVQAGENVMNLTPQPVTEMPSASGE
jgi:hypothetical protein